MRWRVVLRKSAPGILAVEEFESYKE